MKMLAEDFARLELAIRQAPCKPSREGYRTVGLTDTRWRWDSLHLSRFNTTPLYDYLDDVNIDTALRRILP